jgi:hypothetical protein
VPVDPKAEEIAYHVCYEYWMLSEAAKRYRTALRRSDRFQHNMLLEAVLLHGRVICEFLFKPINKKYPNDVRAIHFFDSPKQWKSDKLEALRQSLFPAELLERIDRSLAHLTYDRLKPGARGWHVRAVAGTIQKAWNHFLEQLPKERRQWFDVALQCQQSDCAPKTTK